MNILAIDTSSEILSVALRAEKRVYAFEAAAGMSHSELLIDTIDTVLNLARLEREHLDMIACMEGPGSFTGLRIGFAAAKGLALALGIRYAAVPALDCIAFARAGFTGLTLPLLDARQRRFFCRLYKNGAALGETLDTDAAGIAALLPPDEPVLLAGAGAPLALEQLREALPGAAARLFLDPASAGAGAKDLLRFLSRYDTLPDGADDVAAPVYMRPAV